MSHSTRKLMIEFSGEKRTRRGGIDSTLFSSQHLKHLFLRIDFGLKVSPPPTWDLPALTTLGISRVTFKLDDASELQSIDLFSQFPNLKTLILENCIMSANIDTSIINSSVLESLSLINLPNSCEFVVSTPNLSSFTYIGMAQFSLSVNDLLSLKTVNFQIIYRRSLKKQPKVLKMIIKTFRQLYKADSLTLNSGTLRVLSEFPELQSCPFTSLQNMTIVARWVHISPAEFAVVINYFCRGSPGLKFPVKTQLTPPWMEESFVF
ncbi:uncharacterized protein LOC143572236 [Bidens hawaiensis]|uniref:uncharacterized protein LOC143572236 n=1 Tax=Bidens hawaiensis TaxID=980011 RepID=UPI004049FF0A